MPPISSPEVPPSRPCGASAASSARRLPARHSMLSASMPSRSRSPPFPSSCSLVLQQPAASSSASPSVPDQRWINLIAAIAAITVFGFALGLMFPLLSLIMEKRGVSPGVIGYNTAMQPLGIVVAGFLVPRAVKGWGACNVVIGAALLCAAIVLAYPHLPIAPWWFALRMVQGFAVSTLFSVSEAWVVRFAAGEYRSRILALYTAVLSVSFAGGPAIIAWTGIDSILPFVIGAAVLVAATAPILLLRDHYPAEHDASIAMSIASFAPKAPILLAAVGMFA